MMHSTGCMLSKNAWLKSPNEHGYILLRGAMPAEAVTLGVTCYGCLYRSSRVCGTICSMLVPPGIIPPTPTALHDLTTRTHTELKSVAYNVLHVCITARFGYAGRNTFVPRAHPLTAATGAGLKSSASAYGAILEWPMVAAGRGSTA